MTFGTLSENYEFAAMKSTGISLQRALLSLSIFHLFLGIGTLFFSNHVIPYGELKSYNLRKNLAKLKPTLAIREGIFNEIGLYNIKVEKKYGDNDRFLENVIIHEYTPNKQNNIVIKAERGEMKNEPTEPNLKLVLYNGNRYEEFIPKKIQERKRIPHAKVSFEEYEMNIDLSQFNNIDLDQENIKTSFRMQKINQLNTSIDTLESSFEEEKNIFYNNFSKTSSLSSFISKTKSYNEKAVLPEHVLEFIVTDENWKKSTVYSQGITKVRNSLNDLNAKKGQFFAYQKLINLHKITLQEKYTLLFVSILLFLIGASLGAIIRKGGLGLPLVLSVIIFLTYHYIGLFSKNAAEDSSIPPLIATWLSTIVLAPFSYILTKRASSDKGFISIYNIYSPILNLFKKLPFQKRT